MAASKDPSVASIALKAPHEMYESTPEECSVLGPWAQSYISNEDPSLAYEASQSLLRCKGQYIDALLAEGERRLQVGQFKDPFSQAFREPCFSFMGEATSAEADQCRRVYAFLEKAANDASVASAVRGLALYNIYYQRRDQQTLDLMRKYESSSDPEIQNRAKEAIASLTTTYKLK